MVSVVPALYLPYLGAVRALVGLAVLLGGCPAPDVPSAAVGVAPAE